MLKVSPRTKPQSVIPASVARSMARLDGADTAAISGTPASSAFCTNSNDVRPDTNSSRSSSGCRPSRSIRPAILSTALCRPTSSADSCSTPDRSNSPAACRPPVDANTSWVARSFSGSEAITLAGTVHTPATADTRARSDSIVRRPHKPHDEVIITWRRSPSRTSSRATASPCTVTLMVLSGPSSLMAPISSALRMTSSASRKPAARS